MTTVSAKQNSPGPSEASRWDELWNHGANQNFSIGPSFRHKLRILLRLVVKYRVSGSIMDAACGTGELLSILSERFDDLTGTDISKKALEITAQRLPKVESHLLDLEKASLPKTFDAVFCTNALEEIKDDEAALRNLSSMVNPEGLLFLVVPHRKAYWTQKDSYAGNQRRYERDEIVERLSRNGLHVVEMVTWGWPLYRLWYGAMNSVKQETVWKDQTLSWLARIAASIAYTALFFDDLFWNSSRGSILVVVARKAGR